MGQERRSSPLGGRSSLLWLRPFEHLSSKMISFEDHISAHACICLRPRETSGRAMGRAGGQPMGGCCAPAFGPRGPGPRPPEGRALSRSPRPPPPGRLRHSVARHAWRYDPDATAKGANSAALPHRNLACMRGKSARAVSRSIREGEPRGLTPPLGTPKERALRRARPPPSVTVGLDEAAASALARAGDTGAYADALESSDLPSVQSRADADRALAAHRAAVIAAANATHRSTAAEAQFWDRNVRAHLVSIFAGWAAQTVSGLILSSQRAVVHAHVPLRAAAAARAAAPPSLSLAERRALTARRAHKRRADGAADAAIQCALREREHLHATRLLASHPDAAATVSRARDAARARRAAVASLDRCATRDEHGRYHCPPGHDA